jgi:hypothetical protein
MRNFNRLLLALLLPIAASSPSRADTVSAAGSSLSVSSVPSPGSQGYVFYAWGTVDGVTNTSSDSATPTGIASPGSFTSPVSYVSIDTGADRFFSSSLQNGGYDLLTVNGTSGRTGVAYQAASLGQTNVMAVMTLLSGVPSSFQLGILIDNAPGSQNQQLSITAAGAPPITTAVQGNSAGASNDFYFFDISGAAAGDKLTISTTNNGSAGSIAYTELGGFTFDSAPTPLPSVAGMGGVFMAGLAALCFFAKNRAARAVH